MADKKTKLEWHRIADIDELPEGRVKTVTTGIHSMALTHIDGKYHAMDNRCPHQGGPLGEGSIEKGKLADFVILNKNLFEVDPYEIYKLKPSAVVMEGKVIQGSFPD